MFIIRQQGQVFQVYNLPKKPLPPPKPEKRGNVTGFSVASRRRLIDFLCRMDDGYKRASFVTLTFAGSPSHADAKQALKRFLQRVREYFPEASAVWRMDYQERGAIHFHLLFFNLPFWPQFHLQDTWTECTDEVSSRADIRLIRKFSTYMRYISKYVAKADVSEANPSLVVASYQQKPSDNPGRFWGYFQKELLPLGTIIEVCTGDEDFGKYALFACTGMSHGHCGDSEYTRKCYTQEAANMFAFIHAHANFVGQSWDGKPSEEAIEAQWFGSPGVLAGIGVPLAEPDDWHPVPNMLWVSSEKDL
jgi:hypothetical protein